MTRYLPISVDWNEILSTFQSAGNTVRSGFYLENFFFGGGRGEFK